MTDKVLVFSSPPGGAIDPTGAFKNSFSTSIIGLNPVDNLKVYASPTGSDNNSGLTILTPVQTLRRATTIATNIGWNLTCEIHLLVGDFTLTGPIFSIPTAKGGDQKSGMLIMGDSMTTVISSATVAAVTGGSTSPFLVNVAPTAVNSTMDGYQVTFTSGALNGRTFIIGGAAGNSFNIMESDDTPAPGDTLTMKAPNARIVVSSGVIVNAQSGLSFQDLDVVTPDISTAGATNALIFTQNLTFASGVRFLPTPGASLSALICVGGSILCGDDAPISNKTGCAIMGSAGIPDMIYLAVMPTPSGLSNTLFRDVFMQIQGGSASFNDCLLLRSFLFVINGAFVTLDGTQIRDSLSDGITVQNAGADIVSTDIKNSAGSGIRVVNSGIRIDNVVSTTLNGSAGLELGNQGRCVQISTGSTVSGAVGDVVVGNNPVATWGNINLGVAPGSDFATATPKFACITV